MVLFSREDTRQIREIHSHPRKQNPIVEGLNRMYLSPYKFIPLIYIEIWTRLWPETVAAVYIPTCQTEGKVFAGRSS